EAGRLGGLTSLGASRCEGLDLTPSSRETPHRPECSHEVQLDDRAWGAGVVRRHHRPRALRAGAHPVPELPRRSDRHHREGPGLRTGLRARPRAEGAGALHLHRAALHRTGAGERHHRGGAAPPGQPKGTGAGRPRDILAIQTGHLVDFFRGDTLNLRNRIVRVLPHWSAGVPGYSYLLGMYAFGLEECNQYAEAGETARRALQLEAKDAWAVHAGVHVMEMQGRIDE